MKAIKISGHVVRRWAILTWRGEFSTPKLYRTRALARKSRCFTDEQIVRVIVNIGPHRATRRWP